MSHIKRTIVWQHGFISDLRGRPTEGMLRLLEYQFQTLQFVMWKRESLKNHDTVNAST